MNDRRGTPITVGARVAYNLSGSVATGTVVGIGRGRNGPFKIKPDSEFLVMFYAKDKPLSNVRHWSSLVVLKPGEAE